MAGSELLVRKSGYLASYFGIRKALVGILLLGMGTSAPEWAVSALSSIKGLSALAIGNVMGSNIFNMLILGLILLRPLALSLQKQIKKDLLFLTGTSFILVPILMNAHLSQLDALLLILIFLVYIFICLYGSPVREKSAGTANPPAPLWSLWFWVLLGFVLLIGGSYITIYAAEPIGLALGISERVLGILLVSVGTSLPEFFTCLAALLKGHSDMALGNMLGSNIFNTYAVLGTSGLILPAATMPGVLRLDLPVMLLIYLLLAGLVLEKAYPHWQRFLPFCFLGIYAVYLIQLLSY